jgi:hypothetical protein
MDCKNSRLPTLTTISDMIVTHVQAEPTTYITALQLHITSVIYISLSNNLKRHANSTRATRLKTWPLAAVTTLETARKLREHSCLWRHERRTCFTTLWYDSKAGHVFFSAFAYIFMMNARARTISPGALRQTMNFASHIVPTCHQQHTPSWIRAQFPNPFPVWR